MVVQAVGVAGTFSSRSRGPATASARDAGRKDPNVVLKNTLYHAAFGTHRGTVDDQRLRAGDESDDRRHLVGRFETFQQRARPGLLEEQFLHLNLRDVLLFG